MTIRLVVFFVLVLSSIPALAQSRASLPEGRGQVPVDRVSTLVSREGEDKVAFLQRVGGLLAAYTDATGFEACAQVCASPQRTGVVVTSSRAHAYCAVAQRCPGGLVATSESIHSHPQAAVYVVNENDVVFSGFRDRKGQRKRTTPEQFSDTDFDGGPGYLATGGKLMYQSGRKQVVVMGDLVAPPSDVLQSILAPALTASN